MAKRIKRYLAYIDGLLERDDVDFNKEIDKHCKQIEFFMHERLIHLIVMFLFALATVMSCLAFIISERIQILALIVALMVLLIPYIKHYYLLENSVQKMYEQYDKMLEKAGIEAFK
jgi:Ca2+/Na+ antiporter